ncbi:hypothetical protein [Kribbella sp. NPDC049584]|uniref:hypothetical protein n=1 Tax=Kribbella sp. NPDC049584 TaxID=3154833 RepID=UPI0034294FA9
MNGAAGGSADESAQWVERATADLDDLHRQLIRAGEGQIDTAELRASAEAYWRAHRPVLVALAAALAEQLRAQALQALYQWQRELARSMPPRHDPPR